MLSPEAVADCGASRYRDGGALAVTDVKDPDAVAGVLRRVAPYVTSSFLESALVSSGQQTGTVNAHEQVRRSVEII
jgi:hypothetical protein